MHTELYTKVSQVNFYLELCRHLCPCPLLLCGLDTCRLSAIIINSCQVLQIEGVGEYMTLHVYGACSAKHGINGMLVKLLRVSGLWLVYFDLVFCIRLTLNISLSNFATFRCAPSYGVYLTFSLFAVILPATVRPSNAITEYCDIACVIYMQTSLKNSTRAYQHLIWLHVCTSAFHSLLSCLLTSLTRAHKMWASQCCRKIQINLVCLGSQYGLDTVSQLLIPFF